MAAENSPELKTLPQPMLDFLAAFMRSRASMIVFIANAYDNLRRNRPEQKALSLTNTVDWMDRRLGSVFHPLLLKQFRVLIKAQAAEEVRG